MAPVADAEQFLSCSGFRRSTRDDDLEAESLLDHARTVLEPPSASSVERGPIEQHAAAGVQHLAVRRGPCHVDGDAHHHHSLDAATARSGGVLRFRVLARDRHRHFRAVLLGDTGRGRFGQRGNGRRRRRCRQRSRSGTRRSDRRRRDRGQTFVDARRHAALHRNSRRRRDEWALRQGQVWLGELQVRWRLGLARRRRQARLGGRRRCVLEHRSLHRERTGQAFGSRGLRRVAHGRDRADVHQNRDHEAPPRGKRAAAWRSGGRFRVQHRGPQGQGACPLPAGTVQGALAEGHRRAALANDGGPPPLRGAVSGGQRSTASSIGDRYGPHSAIAITQRRLWLPGPDRARRRRCDVGHGRCLAGRQAASLHRLADLP